MCTRPAIPPGRRAREDGACRIPFSRPSHSVAAVEPVWEPGGQGWGCRSGRGPGSVHATMPVDHDGDEDDERSGPRGRSGKGLTQFDCPSCSAHNPVGDALQDGEEVLCNYCGSEFQVRVSDGGKLKLREL